MPPPPEPPVDPAALDLGHLALFVGNAYADFVQARMAAKGFVGLRVSHGYVVQHLVEADRTVGELADRLGVTQQAASKVAAELEGLGYLARVADPADARVRRVQLTARGRAAIAYARKVRAALEGRLAAQHGARAFAEARALLADVLQSLGGAEAVRARRVRAPR